MICDWGIALIQLSLSWCLAANGAHITNSANNGNSVNLGGNVSATLPWWHRRPIRGNRHMSMCKAVVISSSLGRNTQRGSHAGCENSEARITRWGRATWSSAQVDITPLSLYIARTCLQCVDALHLECMTNIMLICNGIGWMQSGYMSNKVWRNQL